MKKAKQHSQQYPQAFTGTKLALICILKPKSFFPFSDFFMLLNQIQYQKELFFLLPEVTIMFSSVQSDIPLILHVKVGLPVRENSCMMYSVDF